MELFQGVPRDKLEQLADVHGIAREYIAFSGETIVTPLENRLHILAAMGVGPRNEEDVDALLEELEAESWLQRLEPVSVTTPDQAAVTISIPEARLDVMLRWNLQTADGALREGEVVASQLHEHERHEYRERVYSRRELQLGDLAPGYYDLQICKGSKWLKTLLIVAPQRCHEPQWLVSDRKLWGISAQLYTIRQADNWGIGDFVDLEVLIREAAPRGAQFILLNPLHALNNRYPHEASPYSPVDRRFLNPIYIRPETCEDFEQAVDMRDYMYVISEELEECRQQDQVAYEKVFSLKYGAFQGMFQAFCHNHLSRRTPRAREYLQFVKAGGVSLKTFARFQAGVKIEAVPASTDPEFHQYLQWLAWQQLERCQTLALDCGMEIGLVRDLAVGGTTDSCEVSTNPGLFCLNARIGAPPDYFNPDGQNWGLPPLSPEGLRQSRFAHFIELLRTNMAACGALRIDHVMALMRLWWCPVDGADADGAYVHYPVDTLFAILRLESQRTGCMIIGEDLGVVPPEIRPYLDEGGLLSNVVFYFEKYDGWHFLRPEHYKPRALAFAANHDCPPLRSWWNTSDVDLRRSIGLVRSDEQAEEEKQHRLQEKNQILGLFRDYGMLPESWHSRDGSAAWDMELAAAMFRWCGSVASQVLSVQLDDIAGMETPVNIPGTSGEYANWSRRLPVTLTALFDNESTDGLLQALRDTRP